MKKEGYWGLAGFVLFVTLVLVSVYKLRHPAEVYVDLPRAPTQESYQGQVALDYVWEELPAWVNEGVLPKPWWGALVFGDGEWKSTVSPAPDFDEGGVLLFSYYKSVSHECDWESFREGNELRYAPYLDENHACDLPKIFSLQVVWKMEYCNPSYGGWECAYDGLKVSIPDMKHPDRVAFTVDGDYDFEPFYRTLIEEVVDRFNLDRSQIPVELLPGANYLVSR